MVSAAAAALGDSVVALAAAAAIAPLISLTVTSYFDLLLPLLCCSDALTVALALVSDGGKHGECSSSSTGRLSGSIGSSSSNSTHSFHSL